MQAMAKAAKEKKLHSRRARILLTAARLFIEQGYENTGMRQIAEEAGVSLSLANYHFGSKRELGARLISGHFRHIEPYVAKYAREDIGLFAATMLRLNYHLMNTPKLQRFYEDALKNDIYLDALSSQSVAHDEQRELSREEMIWTLSDSYIPAGIERALTLCPFFDLIGMDAPSFIIRHFLYALDFNRTARHTPEYYDEKSKEISARILEESPSLYTIMNDILDYIDDYI